MAFDGFCLSAIRKECNDKLTGGRLYKIAQPEPDELLITFKTPNGQFRLQLSVNASLPLVYLTDENKPSPKQAPNFCMLLRKHLQNGRLISVTQPGFERVLDFEVEHLDEMGDLCHKHLIAEFMGKYSNIIFIDENKTIIDAIKRIPASVSSVREVLPGKTYFIPDSNEKLNPLEVSENAFTSRIFATATPMFRSLYSNLTGLSPAIAQEICYRAGVDSGIPANVCTKDQIRALFKAFDAVRNYCIDEDFAPAIYFQDGIPDSYSAIPMAICTGQERRDYETVSSLLIDYYRDREKIGRIRQKSSDLRQVVNTALERTYKKLDIQEKQLKSTEKREKYRIYGELLQAFGYNVEEGAENITVQNYYDDNKEVTIPLDPLKSAQENATRYFDRYNKLKRTYEADIHLVTESRAEADHLESILTSLDLAQGEDDLAQIREELTTTGYLKHHPQGKNAKKAKSAPLHFVSSDGFDIYVGKNNTQNDELTFKLANGGDWWFHAKQMPGSHVVLRTEGREVPDRAFEEAASLAAHFSKAGNQEKVEVDYVQRKEVKKPASAKPGYVVYYTNYSLIAFTDISKLKEIK